MYTVVITGGIASGKSTACAYLAQRGAASINLDYIARNVVEPPSPVLEELKNAYGADVIQSDGTLDRPKLAERAFVSRESTDLLDSIVHPAITRELLKQIEAIKLEESGETILVLEVPLPNKAPEVLALADEVIAILAPRSLQERRAVDRGMELEDARKRIQHQIDDRERIALADTVIVNDADYDGLIAQLDTWWNERAANGWLKREQ